MDMVTQNPADRPNAKSCQEKLKKLSLTYEPIAQQYENLRFLQMVDSTPTIQLFHVDHEVQQSPVIPVSVLLETFHVNRDQLVEREISVLRGSSKDAQGSLHISIEDAADLLYKVSKHNEAGMIHQLRLSIADLHLATGKLPESEGLLSPARRMAHKRKAE